MTCGGCATRSGCASFDAWSLIGAVRCPVLVLAGEDDEIRLAVQLNRHYPLTVVDPGAAGLNRLLTVADQLVVVVPASAEAGGALADTRDWLDNNGHAELAMQPVTVPASRARTTSCATATP